MYINTRQPNLTIKGKAGWCLSVACDVWNVPHVYPKAIDAWNATSSTNHPNELPPDASVVCYWSYIEKGTQYGHIATWVPGRGLYSSPFNTLYGAEWYPSVAAMTLRIRRIDPTCKYLGWSETLSRVQLVRKDDQMIIQNAPNWKARCDKTMYQMRGRHMSDEEFLKYAVGAEFLHWVEAVSDNKEADTATHWQDVGKTAVNDNWQKQITDLQAQNKALQTQLDAVNNGDTIIITRSGWNGFFDVFKQWLGKK